MQFLVKLVLIGATFAALYYVYQRPEIRELFRESARDEDPLGFLNDLPEITPKEKPDSSAEGEVPGMERKVESPSQPKLEAERPESSPTYQNQVPNEELSRVLMQILAAKKLADGISVSVTDSEVSVAGRIGSQDQKKEILEIIEKGRESRRIDAEELRVQD